MLLKSGVERSGFPPLQAGSVSWGFPCSLVHAVCGTECGGKGLVGGPGSSCDINIGFDGSLL